MTNVLRKITGWKWWLTGLVVLLSIIGFRHMWLWLPAHRYDSLINRSDLVAALEVDQPQQLTSLAGKYHFDYQVFKAGRLVQQSRGGWPHIQFVHAPGMSADVIKASLQDRLRVTQPYQLSRDFHRYIFLASSAGDYTYVIYQKVL